MIGRNLLRLQNFFFLVVSGLTLVSCAVGPDFEPPKAPNTKTYTSGPLPVRTDEIKGEEEKTQEFVVTQQIKRQWWSVFECEKLNHLIERGLHNSPTLQAAKAALSQAEENLNAGQGGFFPSIAAQVGASRQQQSPASFGTRGPSNIFNLYNASVNVSYSPDIFGALRRQVEALDAEVDHKRFDLEAAYLTLTSNIITTAVKEASLRDQIQATNEIISTQEKQLRILQSQFKLGGASHADVLAQETLVAQTKSSLPSLMSAMAKTRHALATLVGELPSEAQLPQITLKDIHLPQKLPLTIASSLVQQRPDIQAAEALLHGASAQIGVAKAQMFPHFVLTGSVGDMNNKFHRLFTNSSNVFSIASQLIQPIFRGGSQIAEENAAIAAYDQAFAQYRGTVLQAFQQVADVLHALIEDAKTHKALVEAEQSAVKSLKISRQQYKLGALNFLSVLTAERAYQQARMSRVQAQAARYADTAALFQALGGDCFAMKQTQLQTPNTDADPACERK
jgi:NodT family efflux transporter outer membrane factor (OMF) lipoprotein